MTKLSTLRLYYFTSFASIGVFLPFLSPWLCAMGLRGNALGVVSATRPLVGIFAPLLFGWFADSLGLRGWLLKWAGLGALLPFAALALLGMGQAPVAHWSILLAVAVSSFFRVPMGTIADVAALEHKKSYGSLRLWGSLGFVAAATLAGKVLDPSRAVPFPALVAGAYLLAFLVSFHLPARVEVPRPPKRREVLELLRSRQFAPLLVAATLWALSHVSYDLTISLHLARLGASPLATSAAWNIGVIAEIALMAISGRFMNRLSHERWLLVGLAATAVRFALLALTQSLFWLMCLQPLHALSFAVVWLASMELVRERARPGLLGSAQGLFSAAVAVGSTLGMLVFAPIYEFGAGVLTFAVAAAVALLAVVTASQTLRQPTVS